MKYVKAKKAFQRRAIEIDVAVTQWAVWSVEDQ